MKKIILPAVLALTAIVAANTGQAATSDIQCTANGAIQSQADMNGAKTYIDLFFLQSDMMRLEGVSSTILQSGGTLQPVNGGFVYQQGGNELECIKASEVVVAEPVSNDIETDFDYVISVRDERGEEVGVISMEVAMHAYPELEEGTFDIEGFEYYGNMEVRNGSVVIVWN